MRTPFGKRGSSSLIKEDRNGSQNAANIDSFTVAQRASAIKKKKPAQNSHSAQAFFIQDKIL